MVQRGELNPFGGSHREIAKKTVSTIILSNMLMFCIIKMGVSPLQENKQVEQPLREKNHIGRNQTLIRK